MSIVTMMSPQGHLGEASTKCFDLIGRNTLAKSVDFQLLQAHPNQCLLVQRDTCQAWPLAFRVSFWRSDDIHKNF